MSELPLFPLRQVLFPGCTLDLQLFEPRYLDMLKSCLKAGTGFGVVSIIRGQEVGPAAAEVSEIGCEAQVRDWHQQDNGLLGIRAQGARRFRVLSSRVQADQLRLAEVQWLPERPELAFNAEHAELQALREALGRHPQVAALELPEPTELSALLDQLAYLLPFTEEVKGQLLAWECPSERLQLVSHWLSQWQA